MVKDGKQLGKTFQVTLTLNRAHLKKQKQNTYSHTQELMQEVHTHTHKNSCKKHKVTRSVRALAFLLAALEEREITSHSRFASVPNM